MKLCIFLFILIAVSVSGFSQDGQPKMRAGFLQMVNLVSLKTPSFIEVAGLSMAGGEPVPTGESSGVVALIPNIYRFSVANESAKPRSRGGSVTVENGKNVIIVFFDEEKEYRDGSKETKLRFTIFRELGGNPGAKLSLVSLSNRESLKITAGLKRLTLAGRRSQVIEVELEDEVDIQFEGESLGEIEIDKPIHYIGFLFDNPETGEPEMSVIQEQRLTYQAPIDDGVNKTKKEEDDPDQEVE